MTDSVAAAFQHPTERSKALAGAPPRDRISMTEHQREVEIGAFQAERGVRQTVQFDVVVEVETRAEDAVDDVDRILSYDTIVEAIDAALAVERVDLLETLAGRIAEQILAHPLAGRCYVRIGKLDRGPYTLGVEIVRDAPSGQRGLRVVSEEMPHPLIVYLSGEAMARADLSALLDRLEASGAPVIMCVSRPATPVPDAIHALPQRRIALLAIEQQAWVLAACDPRCVVVAARTELEWAMRQGRISVWAPSKMVLDAPDGPVSSETGAFALALWLAEVLGAVRVVQIGEVSETLPDMEILRLPADTLPTVEDLGF